MQVSKHAAVLEINVMCEEYKRSDFMEPLFVRQKRIDSPNGSPPTGWYCAHPNPLSLMRLADRIRELLGLQVGDRECVAISRRVLKRVDAIFIHNALFNSRIADSFISFIVIDLRRKLERGVAITDSRMIFACVI